MTTVLYDLSRAVLECVCAQLQDACPKSRCLVPGLEVEWDCCAKGGQLTVGLVSSFPSRSFPVPDSSSSICDVPYIAHTLAVTLLRCAPTGTTARGPSCDELHEAARRQLADVALVQQGLLCCLNDRETYGQLLGVGYKWVLGALTTVGPEGGCYGFVQGLTVGLPNCLDCCA